MVLVPLARICVRCFCSGTHYVCERRDGQARMSPSVPMRLPILRKQAASLLLPLRAARCSEPATAIRNPPTYDEDRNGGSQSPPQWQNDFRSKTQNREREPKHPPLHGSSLSACSSPRGLTAPGWLGQQPVFEPAESSPFPGRILIRKPGSRSVILTRRTSDPIRRRVQFSHREDKVG